MRASTDGLLTEERKELLARSVSAAVREGIREAASGTPRDEAEASSGSGGRGIPGALLLVSVGAAIGYLARWRGMMGGTEGEPASTTTSGSAVETDEESTGGRSTGRGLLSMLLRVGAVAALGYALKRRSGSVGENIDEAGDRTRSVAEVTASRAGWAAQQIDAVTDQAAERIQQVGEETADRVQEGGEETADRVQEGGEGTAEQIEEVAEQAEEVAETAGVAGEGSETEEDDESEGEAGTADEGEDDEE